MADLGSAVGGFLGGFNSTFFPAMKADQDRTMQERLMQQQIAYQNAQIEHQRRADETARAAYELNARKVDEAEKRDRAHAEFFANQLGVAPTVLNEAAVNQMDPSRPELIWQNGGNSQQYRPELTQPNPQYERLIAGGGKAAQDLLKSQKEDALNRFRMQVEERKAAVEQARLAQGDRKLEALMAKMSQKDEGKTVDERVNNLFVRVEEKLALGEPVDPREMALYQKYQANPKYSTDATTVTQRSAVQKELGNLDMLRNQIKNSLDTYKPEYGKLASRAGYTANEYLSMLPGIDQSPESQEYAGWVSSVKQYLNKYRHDITGAQASYPELKYIESSLPNASDSAATFKEKAKKLLESLDRAEQSLKARLAGKAPLSGPASGAQSAAPKVIDINGNVIQ